MGNKARALGSDVRALLAFESTYGALAASGAYKNTILKTFGIDGDEPFGNDPLIGRGRNAQDPYYDAIVVGGPIGVPLDVRASGFHLKGLLGAPVSTAVKATGEIAFSAQPANNSTLTLNGVAWTFVTGSPAGNQTQIGVDLAATLAALRDDLNASANAEIAKVTYAATATQLTMQFDTAGTGGNAWTLAASANSNGTRSAATLLGGGTSHLYKAGLAELPSLSAEIGHPQLSTPFYERYTGIKLNTLTFDMSRSGPLNAELGALAQAQLAAAAATVDADPEAYDLIRFSRGAGKINLGGSPIAAVTAGRFNFSNGMEPAEDIRDDGLISGVDEGEALATGSMTAREGTDATLRTAVAAKTPVALEYVFSHPARWSLKFALPRVYLRRSRREISGPGGIQRDWEWQAAYDAGSDTALEVTLVNDVSSY